MNYTEKKWDEVLEEKLDKLIEKNMPKGVNAKRSNLWLGICAATVAGGLYTAMIDWNPVVRAGAHLTGAFAMPAAGAFVSSLAMSGIEKTVNLGIHLYNKKHPEKKKDDFKINPKVKNIIKLISTASKAIVKPINTLEEKIKQKSKDNDVGVNFDITEQQVSNSKLLETPNKLLSGDLSKYITWRLPNNRQNSKTPTKYVTNTKTTSHNPENKRKTPTRSNTKTHNDNTMEI